MISHNRKAKHCDFCQHHDYKYAGKAERLVCKKGHNPRFYMPKDEFDAQWGDDWGWKRRCNDFEVGDHVQRFFPGSNASAQLPPRSGSTSTKDVIGG